MTGTCAVRNSHAGQWRAELENLSEAVGLLESSCMMAGSLPAEAKERCCQAAIKVRGIAARLQASADAVYEHCGCDD